MASSMVIKVVMRMMVLGALSLQTHATISCGEVENTVSPCISYVTGKDVAIPQSCCNGVKTLNNKANTTPDRQDVCGCLKTIAQGLPELNLRNLAALPANCGINLPYKIGPSIDCKTIQ